MAVVTMSVHEALTFVKTSEARLTKLIQELRSAPLVALRQGADKLVGNSMKPGDFAVQARASVQRMTALQQNITDMRAAIVQSNATTKVVLGDRELTVAEAIAYRKHSIAFDEAYIAALTQQWSQATTTANTMAAKTRENAEKAANQILAGVADAAAQYDGLIKTYMDTNAVSVYDPAGVEALIRDLSAALDLFKTRVDAVLTTSNVSTMLTVTLQD